jgi:hypothetical protein
MKKIILAIVVIVLTIGVAPAAQASTSITKLVVFANGANETPNKGIATGSASGAFALNTTKDTICFSNMKTKGLANVFGAHIHLGAWRIDGSIFITFDFTKFNKSVQTCTKVSHTVLVDIAKHPADYYFNVHTKDFPGGAVRGQLKKST